MPKLDLAAIPPRTGSTYPEPHASAMQKRSAKALGHAGGLTQFGANLVTIEAGGLSSLRHWHEREDEFVWMVSGELVLVEEGGEAVLRPGEAAAFPAGSGDGHHLVNRSDAPATFLVIGAKADRETVHYAEADLVCRVENGSYRYARRDGTVLKEGTR